MTDDRSAFTEAREDLKTPDEWCRIEGVEVMDPDGWRGRDGRPWTDPITLAEFKNRLIICTMRHVTRASADARAEMQAARDAGLQRRHETRLSRVRDCRNCEDSDAGQGFHAMDEFCPVGKCEPGCEFIAPHEPPCGTYPGSKETS